MARPKVRGGNSDHRRLIRDLIRAGYIVTMTAGQHVRVTRPDDGRTVTMSLSPNGGRYTQAKIQGDLRRRVGWDPQHRRMA